MAETVIGDGIPPQMLAGYDMMLWSNRFAVIAFSCTFWVVLYLVSDMVSRALSETYRTIKTKDQVFWSLTVVRGAFGGSAFAYGSYCVISKTALPGTMVSAISPIPIFCVCFIVGFFVFENIALVVHDAAFGTFNVFLTLHHVISLNGVVACLVTNQFYYFSLIGILLEVSTPFTAVSWLGWKMGYKGKSWWNFNQWMMVHAFHGRSFLELFLIVESVIWWEDIWNNLSFYEFMSFYPGLVLMFFVLTPVWLKKKTKALSGDGKKAKVVRPDWRTIMIEDVEIMNRIRVGSTNNLAEMKRRLKTYQAAAVGSPIQ